MVQITVNTPIAALPISVSQISCHVVKVIRHLGLFLNQTFKYTKYALDNEVISFALKLTVNTNDRQYHRQQLNKQKSVINQNITLFEHTVHNPLNLCYIR